MNDPKARSRKKTVDEIQRAIVQLQADQGKLSISAVAKLAEVTPGLIHNTYPDLAEKIRGLVGKATRAQRDAKHDALVHEREVMQTRFRHCAMWPMGVVCFASSGRQKHHRTNPCSHKREVHLHFDALLSADATRGTLVKQLIDRSLRTIQISQIEIPSLQQADLIDLDRYI